MIQAILPFGATVSPMLPTLAEGVLEGAIKGGIVGGIVGGSIGAIMWLFKKKSENKVQMKDRDEEGRS